MSTLLLVRHGQASFLGDDYDQLSPIGAEQARALGHSWADLGLEFDQVYVGPLQRHRQTHEATAEAYRSHGLALPEPIAMPELDEHHGLWVMERLLPQLAEQDVTVRDLMERRQGGERDAQRQYLKLFQQITRQWARGEIDMPEAETWPAFRQRVQDGLRRIMHNDSGGKTVVAFTSGGTMAVAMGWSLNLSDEQIIELSWIIRNAACSEFLFSGRRFSLSVFNATPHLIRPELLTYV
jgi:broad specificity phosphatase PhoE